MADITSFLSHSVKMMTSIEEEFRSNSSSNNNSSSKSISGMDNPMTGDGDSWVVRSFSGATVAFAMNLRNFSREGLKHIKTGTLSGSISTSFAPPEEILPGSSAVVVASNESKITLAGTYGVSIWRIGSTQYYLTILWSAPRNFYTHANIMAVAITNGMPISYQNGGYKALFNRIYYAKPEEAENTFHCRLVCNYGEGTKEASYTTNRYHFAMRLGQDHKSFNQITVTDTFSTDAQMSGGHGYVSFRKARVKILAHSRKGAYSRRNTEPNQLSLERNHVALMFEWSYPERSKGETEDDVIVCELVGDPGTKRDINLSDASRPSCVGTTKSKLLRERKNLGLRAFNMGETHLNEEDLAYLVNQRVTVRTELGLNDRCSRWLTDLACLMNLPDQELILEARDSLVKEGPLQVASHPLASSRSQDLGSGGTQEALLLALSATPFKIAAAEKIRSRECSKL